jgi:hypothetical protein
VLELSVGLSFDQRQALSELGSVAEVETASTLDLNAFCGFKLKASISIYERLSIFGWSTVVREGRGKQRQ